MRNDWTATLCKCTIELQTPITKSIHEQSREWHRYVMNPSGGKITTNYTSATEVEMSFHRLAHTYRKTSTLSCSTSLIGMQQNTCNADCKITSTHHFLSRGRLHGLKRNHLSSSRTLPCFTAWEDIQPFARCRSDTPAHENRVTQQSRSEKISFLLTSDND